MHENCAKLITLSIICSFKASDDPILLPETMRSSAACKLVRRGKRCDPVAAGRMPRVTSGNPKLIVKFTHHTLKSNYNYNTVLTEQDSLFSGFDQKKKGFIK